MRLALAFLVFWSVLALGGCRSASAGADDVPSGTWTVVRLEGVDLAPLARAPEITLGADGTLSGFAGVNRFSGRVEPEALRAGQLRAGPLAATRMAGPPEAMAVEDRLLALLTSALDWRREGAELTLWAEGRPLVRLREAH